jgi:hypothetical protein
MMKLPVVGKTYFDIRLSNWHGVLPFRKKVIGVNDERMIVVTDTGSSFTANLTEDWQVEWGMYDSFYDACVASDILMCTIAAYEEDEIFEQERYVREAKLRHEAQWQLIPVLQASIKEMQDEGTYQG